MPYTYVTELTAVGNRVSKGMLKKVKAEYSSWESISELRGVTCPVGSHSVTCHPTQVNAPRHNPSQPGQYSIYLPRGMEGWVDLDSLMAARAGIEPTTAWSQVRRPNRYATKPPIWMYLRTYGNFTPVSGPLQTLSHATVLPYTLVCPVWSTYRWPCPNPLALAT